MATLKRTKEQVFADSMDEALSRQGRRAEGLASDPHWNRISLLIESVRGLVRQRMSEEDKKATPF